MSQTPKTPHLSDEAAATPRPGTCRVRSQFPYVAPRRTSAPSVSLDQRALRVQPWAPMVQPVLRDPHRFGPAQALRLGAVGAASAVLVGCAGLTPPKPAHQLSFAPVLRMDGGVWSADGAYYAGKEALAQGRVHEALMLFERAATLRPRFDDALNGQVVALARLGRTAQAIDVAQQAVRAGASAAELHGNLGLMLLRAGRADEAWARLEQASRLDPDNSTWTVALARRPATVPANVAQAPTAPETPATAAVSAPPAASTAPVVQAAPAAVAVAVPVAAPVPAGAPVVSAAPAIVAVAPVAPTPITVPAAAAKAAPVNAPAPVVAAAPMAPAAVVQPAAPAAAAVPAEPAERQASVLLRPLPQPQLAAAPVTPMPAALPLAPLGTVAVAPVAPVVPAAPEPEVTRSPVAAVASPQLRWDRSQPNVLALRMDAQPALAIANPAPVTPAVPGTATATADAPRPLQLADASQSTPRLRFTIEVSNGAGAPGLAKATSQQLRTAGVQPWRITNHSNFKVAQTEIQYRGKGDAAAARQLARKMGVTVALVENPNLHASVNLRVVLGKDVAALPAGKRLLAEGPEQLDLFTS